MRHNALSVLSWCSTIALAAVQISGQNLTGSFPHNYPGIPNTDGNFSDSDAWQNYFVVKEALPNITFPLTRSFAGNLPVNREGHPNNTLFFWAFEKTNGSLTEDSDHDEPWVIWLNGGPGASSMLGFLHTHPVKNGPIHFKEDFTAFSNNYSWNNAADTFWIDQPVGTGWSTSDVDAFVEDDDQMASDFFGFLSNVVQVFPSLATRPLYITGESYCGIYIPYIAKHYVSLPKPPVSLRKIAIGDGLYGDGFYSATVPIVTVIETYPQLIGYDTDVLEYFKEQSHLCGLDVNLTYPQHGLIIPSNASVLNPGAIGSGPISNGLGSAQSMRHALTHRTEKLWEKLSKRGTIPRHNEETRRAWKRDLSGRANGTIDPWYGCDLFDEVIDYAVNFSVPWKGNSDATGFDIYVRIFPMLLTPKHCQPLIPSEFPKCLSPSPDPDVAAAIHAPTCKNWSSVFTPESGYPFGGSDEGDPSIPPAEFFSDLATNLSAHGIHWLLYSGNADALLGHFDTEVVIQNTTFGGIQGFTQKPSTPWYDEEGNFAGKIHQERNLTYALFDGAGHLVPQTRPIAALTFLKQFILGNNPLGTVLANGTVVGGTNSSLAEEILPAVNDPIYSGSGTTQGTVFYPSATIAAWNSFTATANAKPTVAA